MKIIRFVLTITILSTVLAGCSYPQKAASPIHAQKTEDTTSLTSPSLQENETDLTISLKSEYYFDENTKTLVYFEKDKDSKTLRYNLVLIKNGQEKKKILSLPSIPESFVIDGDWIYFNSDSIKPDIDPNYEKKLRNLKEISKFFGESKLSNFFRKNLETKEIQWLGSASSYVLDDKHIYFLEVPLDLDQYGFGKPKGCVVFNNSLCRMDKNGSNPMLVSSEKNQILKITDKYIYSEHYRIDKTTFKEENQSLYDYSISDEVYYLDKRYYTKWDGNTAIVYCYDSNTKETIEIANYSVPPKQIIPLENGELIIWQSDSRNRETKQVAKIYFYDEKYKLKKIVEAKGRYHLTIQGNKVFYILQEINDGKSIYAYTTGDTYSTLTLCSDDLSMQGDDITKVGILNDSVFY